MPIYCSIAVALLAMGCAPTQAPLSGTLRASIPAAESGLVVLITVDQLRADYFDRWGGQLTGGLGRVARQGAFFADAVHDHAITETAPGHAAIASGRHPVHTGIAKNTAGVFDTTVTLVGVDGYGASPFRFRGTALADWIIARHPSARVVSVSTKDRGAILSVGRHRGDVYWYSGAGHFVTSSYYRDTLPGWVQRFNDQRLPEKWAGREWNLLLSPDQYTEPDSVAVESAGRNFVFPHLSPAEPEIARQTLPTFPWVDELTLGFALHAVRSLRLGADRTDYLAISLSGTDYIGHRFGPDSREIHDQILRLDRSLGAFLDTLFTLVDSRRVTIALTGDHGVAPFPEVNGYDGLHGGHRVSVREIEHMARAGLPANLDTMAVTFGSGALSLDRRAFAQAGVNADSVVRAFKESVARVPGVARVDHISELARRDTVTDVIARRWLHMFDSDTAAAVVVTLAPYSYWMYVPAANHGSPHDYDARVPLAFWGAPFRAARHTERVRVVDLAPTLARALGLTISERIDGRVLTDALK